MAAVTVMHEKVHERTGQKQQERQRTEEVGTVFTQQEECGDGSHDKQADSVARAPHALGLRVMRGVMVVH